MTDSAIGEPIDDHIGVWHADHLIRRLLMATEAPAHRRLDDARDAIHLFDRAVTGLTRDLRGQMRNVREISIGGSRYAVDALPRRLGAGVSVLENLLHFGAVGFDRPMAKRALLCARDQHMRSLSIAVLMTESALQLLLDMYSMTVGDRLFGRVWCAARPRIEHGSNQRDDYKRSENEPGDAHNLLVFTARESSRRWARSLLLVYSG
jgi:hypothetical protein